MNKKTIKSIMVVLMLLSVGLYCVSGTYARYTSTASGTATVQVAKWAGSVNGADITTETTFDLEFTYVENANVVDGFIAPTSQAYAEFKIDPAGSQVAMDYSFTLGEITGTNVPTNLKISKVVSVEGSTETEINNYSGTIELASQTEALKTAQAKTFRVYVEWEDKDNVNDTTVGKAAPTFTIEVGVTLTQDVD